MNTGLLSCTNTDCLSVFYKADRIGLCVFQNDQGNFKVSFSFLSKFFILCNNIGDQLIINSKFLTTLLKSNAKYLFVFQRFRNIILINLDHIIVALFLLFQDLKCFLCVSRRDNSVRNLPLDQHCRILVTYIRKRNKITER